MSNSYQPPFTLTSAIVNIVAEIAEPRGRLSDAQQPSMSVRLRRINRIRSIQGSLAIEGNTLSESQITAILEGKRVLAPPREIQEARNALIAYERLEAWVLHKQADLLAAHGVLMAGLLDHPGSFRTGGVGIMNQGGAKADSGSFIDFMLQMIRDAVVESTRMSEKKPEKTSEKILRLIAKNPQITIAELASLTGLTPRTIERNLQGLQVGGRLRRVGPDKGGHWEIAKNDAKTGKIDGRSHE